MKKLKGRPRARGTCPSCWRQIAVKKGVGPYADGRGEVMEHKNNGIYCRGGKVL